MKIIFFKQMESSFGKNFAIIAKLALSGSLATSRPYKKGRRGGDRPHFSHILSRAYLAVSHLVPEPRSLTVPCLRSSCRERSRAMSPTAAPVHCRALVQPRPTPVPPSPLPSTAKPATPVPWPSRDLPCSNPSTQTHPSAPRPLLVPPLPSEHTAQLSRALRRACSAPTALLGSRHGPYQGWFSLKTWVRFSIPGMEDPDTFGTARAHSLDLPIIEQPKVALAAIPEEP